MGWPESQVQAVGEPAPKSWEDFRLGCIGTYRGGHDGKEAGAFVHGMNTVFSLLEHEFPPAEACKAAPELLEACEAFVAAMECETQNEGEDALVTAGQMIQAAIAKATPAAGD